MTVKITLKQLKQAYACEDQLKLFEETFGEEVGFKTKAQAIKMASKMAHKFDFNWASTYLLIGNYRKAYEEARAPLWETYSEAKDSLWEAYEEARAPLWETYLEARAPLWETYLEARAPLWEAYKAYRESKEPLWKAYEEARAPFWGAFQEAVVPLWKAYKEAIAKEFAKCYFNQEDQKNHS